VNTFTYYHPNININRYLYYKRLSCNTQNIPKGKGELLTLWSEESLNMYAIKAEQFYDVYLMF